ncbi:MAG: c-type cytochrome [Rhodospirillales bacterium]
MTKRTKTVVAAFVAFGLLATAATAAAADMSVLDKRKDLMKNVVLKNFKVVKDFAKEGKGSAADVKKAADALAAAAAKIPPLFTKGTGRPDVDPRKTRAVARIWEDWAGFEAAAKVLGDEAAKLAGVAAGGDKRAIVAQFINTGKKGCGGCHKSFRGKKVK